MRTFINRIVKNKINFMNLLAATNWGQICPSERLPPLILTGLIHPSDTDNYVSQTRIIAYMLYKPFKNHIAIDDNTKSYTFYEI